MHTNLNGNKKKVKNMKKGDQQACFFIRILKKLNKIEE